MDVNRAPRTSGTRRIAIRSWLWATFWVLLAIGIAYTLLLAAL